MVINFDNFIFLDLNFFLTNYVAKAFQKKKPQNVW